MATQPPFPGALTPEQIQAAAQAQVDAGLAPERADIKQQQADAAAQTAQTGQAIVGLSQALSEQLGGIAPSIQGAFRAGATDTAAFGAGFSDGLKMSQQSGANQVNGILSNIGAPEGQMLHPGNEARDFLYGLGGYLPAKNFSEQGAAFTSAAAFLPATALLQGQRDFAVNVAKGRETQKGFERYLQQLDEKAPGMLAQAVSSLNQEQLQRFSAWLQMQYLKLSTSKVTGSLNGKPTLAAKSQAQKAQAAKQKTLDAKQAKLDKAWGTLNAGIDVTAQGFFKETPNPAAGLDPTAPATTLKQTKTRTQAFNILWRKYGIQAVKAGANKAKVKSAINAALTTAGFPVAKKPKKPPSYGGFAQIPTGLGSGTFGSP